MLMIFNIASQHLKSMKVLILCIFVFFFTFAFTVNAHETPFLELNPDSFRTGSLGLFNQNAVYEIFIPQNDFLRGFDFWLDNDGDSGEAVFKFYDQNNNLLSAKTAVIPHISPISGGQRFHVDFSSQIPIAGIDKYLIKIESSLPDLRIYFFDKINFLSHNAPLAPQYLTGLAKLGDQEQDFSFKYALYEGLELALPVISNIAWTILSPSEMKVNFNANEPVDYRVEYGISSPNYTNATAFTGGYQFCVSGVAVCSLMIPVSPNTAYQYLLTVKDSWGNQNKVSGAFSSGQSQQSGLATTTPTGTGVVSPVSTPGPVSPSLSPSSTPDTTPPLMSNLKIASVTDKSVAVAWTTDEAANSNLSVSFTTELIAIAQSFDSTFELEHLLKTDSVLNPGTLYLATITSRDFSNNTITASISFTTLAKPLPVPESSFPAQPMNTSQPSGQVQDRGSLITVTETYYSAGSSSFVIEWRDHIPDQSGGGGGYRIDIIDEAGQLKEKILVSKESKSVEVKNLPDGEYSVIVYKDKDGVFEKVSQPVKLKVGEKSFVEKLGSALPYLIIALALLIFLAWRLFGKRSSQKILSAQN